MLETQLQTCNHQHVGSKMEKSQVAGLMICCLTFDWSWFKAKESTTLFRIVGKVNEKNMSITQHFQFNDRLVMFIYEAATEKSVVSQWVSHWSNDIRTGSIWDTYMMWIYIYIYYIIIYIRIICVGRYVPYTHTYIYNITKYIIYNCLYKD